MKTVKWFLVLVFFYFWFSYINDRKHFGCTFKTIIISVNSDTIVKHFGKNFAFILQSCITDEDLFPTWPCVVSSFCPDCFKKGMLLVAYCNDISYEEAKKQSCSRNEFDHHYNLSRRTQCSYCKLFNCFAKIAEFVFVSITDSCILAHEKILWIRYIMN